MRLKRLKCRLRTRTFRNSFFCLLLAVTTFSSFTPTGSRKSSWIRALLGIGPRSGTILSLKNPNQSHADHRNMLGLLRDQMLQTLQRRQIRHPDRNLAPRLETSAMARALVAFASMLKSRSFLISQPLLAYRQDHLDLHTSLTTRNWEGCYHHASVRDHRNMSTKGASTHGGLQTRWKQETIGSVQLASTPIAFLDCTGALL